MRILLVCRDFRSMGGVEEIVDNVGAEFAAAGHTVAVLSKPKVPEYMAGHERALRAGLECVDVRVPERKPATWRHPERLIRGSRGTRELVTWLRNWRPDIVNCHITGWEHAVTVTDASRAACVPIVYSLGGLVDAERLSPRQLRLFKSAPAIVAISQAGKRLFDPFPDIAAKVRVITCGVDDMAADAATPARRERSYIFCTSRLDLQHKAIDALIRAFAMLGPRYSELDLLIGGEGPDRGQIELQIASAELGGRVQLVGFKSRDELWGLYKGALVFAMPSKRAEGLGLVFLEAMACGTPVIGTRSGGAPEIIIEGETGLLVDRNEPEELAATIRKLLDDPEMRARMGRQGRQFAVQHSWRRAAQRYLDLYAS
ncbi:MAG: glycosyltransferase family 4 protein, partial [Candidatus Binataceae bacterium]